MIWRLVTNSVADGLLDFSDIFYGHDRHRNIQRLCPAGYFFVTNITYRMDFGNGGNEYSYYLKSIRQFREQYQDIYVGDAYDINGNLLSNSLSIYAKKKPRKFKANRIRKYMAMRGSNEQRK